MIIVAGGAGADGKTTVLELIGKYLGAENKEPLLIDANPDQTLLSFFGVGDAEKDALPKICDQMEWLKSHLEGDNPDYPEMIKVVDTSPITPTSKRWSLNSDNEEILQKLSISQDGARLMHTGTYQATDLGGGCLHAKIGPLVFMLQRLFDGAKGEEGVVLVDNAHGRDAFGTSLYAQGDAVLVVAQPDMKSAEILRDYLSMAKAVSEKINFPINVIVVGNKMSTDAKEFAAEEKFLKTIAGDAYVGGLQEDKALKRKFSNTGPSLDQLSPHNYQMIAKIAGSLETLTRIPERRKVWMDLCHAKGTWRDILTAPGITDQKTNFIPDSDDGETRYTHVHGPHCKH